MLFSRKNQPVIGLDISTTAIKLLQLARSDDQITVTAYAAVPLPPNAVEERTIVSPELVGDAIHKAVKLAKVKTKNAACSVAGSSVITKVITMPTDLPDEEMENQIRLEADQYIPYAIEEVYLDFAILGPTKGNEETVDVLLAASRSEHVDLRVEALEAGGLKAQIVDIDAYVVEGMYDTLAAQLPPEIRDGTTAIVDIGAQTTTLMVFSKGLSVYVREQQFGGKQLTEEIQHRYGLSFKEAGLAKKRGGLPESYEVELLEPFKFTVAQQLSRMLQIFQSSTNFGNVNHIIVAGGSASIDGLSETIAAETGIPSSRVNPLLNMAIAPHINRKAITEDAPALLTAAGLAMRSFENAGY